VPGDGIPVRLPGSARLPHRPYAQRSPA
jgi:hypothetical protein